MKKNCVAVGMLCLCATGISANPRFSADVLLGNANQETEIDGGAAVSGDSLLLGLRTAYAFNQYLSAELSYLSYGEMEDSFIDEFGDTITDKVEVSSLNLGAKGVLPVRNGFALVGRVGASRWNYDVKETDSSLPGQAFKGSDDGIDVYYGVGAEYVAATKVRIALEYTYLAFDGVISGTDFDHSASNLALSLGYAF